MLRTKTHKKPPYLQEYELNESNIHASYKKDTRTEKLPYLFPNKRYLVLMAFRVRKQTGFAGSCRGRKQQKKNKRKQKTSAKTKYTHTN